MNPNTPSNPKNSNTEDEIDLGKLFEKIGNFFLNLILIFFRNIKVLIGIVVFTVALALTYYFLQKPVFISEVTLSSKYLNTKICSDLIYDLRRFVEEENFTQLDHALKLDKGQAEVITDIEFRYTLSDDEMEKVSDSSLLVVPFKVIVQVKDNDLLDSLGERMKSYIENNRFAKRRELIEKDNMRNQINLLVAQRKSLDTLKKSVSQNLYSPRSSGNGYIFGEPYEPLNIYREEIAFYNKELDLRRQLIESESVEIIQDFTKFKKPRRSVGLIKSVFYGGLIGAIIGLIFIIIKEIGASLRRYELRKKAESSSFN